MVCGEYIKTKLGRESEDSIHLVSNYIDQNKFTPDPSARKTGQIMALPRKKIHSLREIQSSVSPKSYNFDLVDGVSESEMIKHYQQSDVFLATGYPEGFGLPPIEAMACGAAVVGFTGGGANEYMVHNETALVAPDADSSTAAKLLIQLMEDPELKERLRRNGIQTAQKYTIDNTRKQLEQFFSLFDN